MTVFSMTQGALAQQEVSATKPDFLRIQQFARLSNTAYSPQDNLIGQGRESAYTPLIFQTIPQLEVAFFLTTQRKTGDQIIAVRGTSNIENALVDISLKLKMDQKAKVKLHNGFSLAASSIYNAIKPKLDKSKPIHTTGHSLGGAVALILAMYLDQEGYIVGDIITFGQPKVTNVAGSNTYQHLKLLRIVTPRDLVPLVPVFDPLDINNLDVYWHAGTELVLNPDASYSLLQGLNSMLRATRFTQRMLDEQNLIHHKMTLYLDLIDNKISRSIQVPYKNSFNLFNLFGQ